MSQKDPSLKRLGLTVAIVIYVFCFNICQAVLLNVETTEIDTTNDDNIGFEGISGDINVIGIDAWGTIISFVAFFFGGFLLTIADFPLYMIAILTPIYLFTLIGFWLLVFDYIKDISILGSGI